MSKNLKQFVFSCGHKAPRPENKTVKRHICKICKAKGIKTVLVAVEITCIDCGKVFQTHARGGKRDRCESCQKKHELAVSRKIKAKINTKRIGPKVKKDKSRMCTCCGIHPIMKGNLKLCEYCYKGIDTRVQGWDYSGMQLQTMPGRGFE